jgi:hypothetical protein
LDRLFWTFKQTPEDLRASNCALCQLFGSVSPSDFDKKGSARTPFCHLRAFSAGREFAQLEQTELRNVRDRALLGVVRVGIGEASSGRGGAHMLKKRSLKETGYLCPLDTKRTQPLGAFGVHLIRPESFDVEFVRNCIAFCQEHHGRPCTSSHTEPIEFLRVIECHTRRIVTAPPDCQYVALSYVWGSLGPESQAVVGKKSCGPLLDDAPKVISDSIDVTLKLQLQYLWVDRYCINQSDEDDKHNQIRQMDLIYANARVTIIAAAGEGPAYGLPGVNGTPR